MREQLRTQTTGQPSTVNVKLLTNKTNIQSTRGIAQTVPCSTDDSKNMNNEMSKPITETKEQKADLFHFPTYK
jgi:hypothetical protein